MQVDYWKLIQKYIKDDWTRAAYTAHVSLVTAKSLKIAKSMNLKIEQLRFIEEAAMLHDIGIINVSAPKINCNGTLPYICHGTEGSLILQKEGLSRHALVCERHTGVGITLAQILEYNLPLPKRDMVPVSLEEKIITWADLFYTKSPTKLLYEKTIAEAFASIKDYGQDDINRFREWEKMFAQFS